jgi:hypothetical protein
MATGHNFSVYANASVRPPINPKTGFPSTFVDRKNEDGTVNKVAEDPSPTGNEQPAGALTGSIDFVVYMSAHSGRLHPNSLFMKYITAVCVGCFITTRPCFIELSVLYVNW